MVARLGGWAGSAGRGCWLPRLAGGELGEHPERVLALFAGGGDVGAHPEVALGALIGAPAAGDLLLQLDAEIITTTPAGYCLRVGSDELDAQQFERLVEDGRRALGGGQPERAATILRSASR